ncbi:MAG TPA: hypothetical protein VGO47_06980, partial [Chlamydiales bacterium]|nr:hypothetical protein [Chlamydiales bacterium]
MTIFEWNERPSSDLHTRQVGVFQFNTMSFFKISLTKELRNSIRTTTKTCQSHLDRHLVTVS